MSLVQPVHRHIHKAPALIVGVKINASYVFFPFRIIRQHIIGSVVLIPFIRHIFGSSVTVPFFVRYRVYIRKRTADKSDICGIGYPVRISYVPVVGRVYRFKVLIVICKQIVCVLSVGIAQIYILF